MTTTADLDFWNARAVAGTTPFFMFNVIMFVFNWAYIALRVSPYANYKAQRTLFAVLCKSIGVCSEITLT